MAEAFGTHLGRINQNAKKHESPLAKANKKTDSNADDENRPKSEV